MVNWSTGRLNSGWLVAAAAAVVAVPLLKGREAEVGAGGAFSALFWLPPFLSIDLSGMPLVLGLGRRSIIAFCSRFASGSPRR
jgi:hypothetical protein